METMRFRETKKSSYKGQIFLIVLFLLLGAGITYFAITTEKEPTLIGKVNSDTSPKTDESDALIDIEKPLENPSEIYSVDRKSILDNTSKKIKPNISVPTISINGEPLVDINEEIYNLFNNRYKTLKSNEDDTINNFTYTVTYNVYENVIANKNILSITLYERMIDDSAKTNFMERVYAYNINLRDGNIIEQRDIVVDFFGPNFRDIIRLGIKDYIIGKKMLKESEYTYTCTGMETFYFKNNEFHIIFNTEEIVHKKYSILDITIKQ